MLVFSYPILPAMSQNIGQLSVTPMSGPAPLMVKFKAMVTTDIPQPYTQSLWTPGDGGSVPGFPLPEVTYTYQRPGEYFPSYSLKDANGNIWEFRTDVPIIVSEPAAEMTVSLSANPIKGQVPLKVIFKATVTDGKPPFKYMFDFGDDTNQEMPSIQENIYSVEHVYNHAGEYYASVTVTDASGNVKSYTISDFIVINPPPQLVIKTVLNPFDGQSPLTVSFNITASGGLLPYKYNVDFGDGSPLYMVQRTNNDPVITKHEYKNPGTYPINMTVEDAQGTRISDNKEVVVYPPPTPMTIELTTDQQDGQLPFPVNFSVRVMDGEGPFTYFIDYKDGNVQRFPSIIDSYYEFHHEYRSTGDYMVSVEVTDVKSQKASGTVSIHVGSGPLELTVETNPMSGMEPLDVVFLLNATGGALPYEYSVDFGDGSPLFFAQEQNTNTVKTLHKYIKAGEYEAKIHLTDAANIVAEQIIPIIVEALPEQLTLNIEVISGLLTENNEWMFILNPKGGTEPYRYKYSFGDGTPEEETTDPQWLPLPLSHIYAEPGVYVLTVTVMDKMDQTLMRTIEVIVPSQLQVQLSAQLTEGVIPLDNMFFAEVSGGISPYTFFWKFGNDWKLITREGSARFIYYQAGQYQASVTVVDKTGQSITSDPLDINVGADLDFRTEIIPRQGLVPLKVNFNVIVIKGKAPFTFVYDFGDGVVSANNPNTNNPFGPLAFHKYVSPGRYTINITVTDANGLKKTNNFGQVTVYESANIETVFEQSFDSIDQAANQSVDSFESLLNMITQSTDEMETIIPLIENAEEVNPETTVATQLNQSTGTLLNNTTNQLAQLINTMTATTTEITPIMNQVGQVFQRMAANNIPIENTMRQQLTNLTHQAFRAGVNEALQDIGVTQNEVSMISQDSTYAQTFFQNRPDAVGRVFDMAQVPVGTQWQHDRTRINQVGEAMGLDEGKINAIQLSLPEVIDVQRPVSQTESNQTLTVLDVLINMMGGVNDLTTDVQVDDLSGAIRLRPKNKNTQALAVNNLGVVPTELPEGLHQLPDGSMIGIEDDVAIKIVPTALDQVGLSAAVADLGWIPEFFEDGRFTATYDTASIVAGLSWLVTSQNTFQSGTVSFDLVGDPGTEAYSVLIGYADGTTQFAPPMIMGQSELFAVLDSLIPGQYMLDRNTGILTLTGYGSWRPDYAFEGLSYIDYVTIQNAGGTVANKIALEVNDFNNDGVFDFYYYSSTPMGRQILYGVK
ncbi:MAG: PKD domain-containing protein [Desulfobacterales bacterium]|nr:PKD domain-containing protein [Desulfobacterales bacterium]